MGMPVNAPTGGNGFQGTIATPKEAGAYEVAEILPGGSSEQASTSLPQVFVLYNLSLLTGGQRDNARVLLLAYESSALLEKLAHNPKTMNPEDLDVAPTK
jgi:hypothetical protein